MLRIASSLIVTYLPNFGIRKFDVFGAYCVSYLLCLDILHLTFLDGSLKL